MPTDTFRQLKKVLKAGLPFRDHDDSARLVLYVLNNFMLNLIFHLFTKNRFPKFPLDPFLNVGANCCLPVLWHGG